MGHMIIGLTLLSVCCMVVSSQRSGYDAGHQGHHGHNHERPHGAKGGSFSDGVIFDKEHIYEDIKEAYNLDMGKDSLSDDEIAFYYFQTHDFDKNGKLDGLEILTAMNHILDEPEAPSADGATTTTTVKPGPENDGPVEEFYRMRSQKKWNKKFLEDSEFIDTLITEYDGDRDGFLSYAEYMRANQESHKQNA